MRTPDILRAACRQAIGVYAGASMNTYLISQLMRNPEFIATVGGYQIMLGNDKDFLSTRISYELDLRGPSLTIQTACSTSLVAVVVACQALSGRRVRHGVGWRCLGYVSAAHGLYI